MWQGGNKPAAKRNVKSHKPHYVKSRHAAKFLIYARERGPVSMLGAVIRAAAL